MNIRYRRRSDATALLGAGGVVFGFWLYAYCEGFSALGEGSLAAGALLLFSSFMFYVRAKGYPAWWCLLFFVTGPGAFVVIWFLPDRYHDHPA